VIYMSQPVKVSDGLLLDARLAGEAAERSIAGQIEYWARLGRAVELHLRTAEALRLKRDGEARPLSELVATVGTAAGRKRFASVLRARPFPHFQPAPGKRGLLVKIDRDGTRTLGRFVHREFRPSK
jgi:ParD-like antitoxin of type II bacterial toxin-antitoxin system